MIDSYNINNNLSQWNEHIIIGLILINKLLKTTSILNLLNKLIKCISNGHIRIPFLKEYIITLIISASL
jgi:hypothetical protein